MFGSVLSMPLIYIPVSEHFLDGHFPSENFSDGLFYYVILRTEGY